MALKYLPALICNRMIKLLGHTTKCLCYAFHAIFPKKRFSIARHKKAILQSKTQSVIPRIVWLTNYTHRVSLPVYLNYMFNRLMAPGYDFRYMDDEEQAEFIADNYPQQIQYAYQQISDGAAKADFWRLLVLHHFGGIYIDMDAHFVWPLGKMVSKNSDELLMYMKNHHFTNYFMASKPSHPLIWQAIQLVVENIEKGRIEKGVYYLTGPEVLNQALEKLGLDVNERFYRYTAVQGSFTNEHFQYIDKRGGKWIHVAKSDILKNKE